MQESELITIWQEQRLERKTLRTEAGETLEIVYPGRRNEGRGGDFRDAAIMLGGRLVTGDVEVHVRSRGWQEHRHDCVFTIQTSSVGMKPVISTFSPSSQTVIPMLSIKSRFVAKSGA